MKTGILTPINLFCVSMGLAGSWSATAANKAARPNVLVILADDLGYHDVSYYGTPDIRTPNIDNLCRAGIRFDNFYANSPVSSPSRASLMSGCYPERVGVPGLVRSAPEENFGYLKPDALLLPKLLKAGSYHTAIIGKWNLGLQSPNLPNEKGFDYFHGFLDDMMEDYWSHLRRGINFMRENNLVIDPKGHATDIFTGWAVDYIRQQAKSNDPFFLYLAYNAPHVPIQPPAEWLQKVKEREPGITDKRAGLVALIEQLDDGIGQVIKSLKESGAYENTVIVFLSDNGGQLSVGANNGKVRDGKGSVYEGGIRVPAFVVWPNHIQPGAVTAQTALTMDIYPTISEIAGIPVNHSINGVSLLPILKDPQQRLPERLLFFTRREGGRQFGGQTIQAVISGSWKLLQNSPYKPYELYNLSQDTLEQRDLLNVWRDQADKLQQRMIEHIQEGGSVPWQKPVNN
jgi:arylsulfatase A-like enzyme